MVNEITQKFLFTRSPNKINTINPQINKCVYCSCCFISCPELKGCLLLLYDFWLFQISLQFVKIERGEIRTSHKIHCHVLAYGVLFVNTFMIST